MLSCAINMISMTPVSCLHLRWSGSYFATDRQPARPSWYRAPIRRPWPHSNYYWTFPGVFLWARSLTRGQACNLSVQLLLGLASAVTLWSKSRRTRDYILLSHLSPGSLLVATYDLQGYGGGILSCLHTGCIHEVRLCRHPVCRWDRIPPLQPCELAFIASAQLIQKPPVGSLWFIEIKTCRESV
jgi:hypothetical protein